MDLRPSFLKGRTPAGTTSRDVLQKLWRSVDLPDESLERIFQPFYRVSDARERRTGGTGLGLAIAERAIRRHGGAVRAVNAPEGGLIVCITLPALSPAA